MSTVLKYRVLNLSKLDVTGITSQAPAADITVEEPRMDSNRHNELATLALSGSFILLGMAAAYFFGKSNREEYDMVIEEIKPNGSIRRINLKLRRSSTEPVENQILEGLKAAS